MFTDMSVYMWVYAHVIKCFLDLYGRRSSMYSDMSLYMSNAIHPKRNSLSLVFTINAHFPSGQVSYTGIKGTQPTAKLSYIQVKNFQYELMVKIYSKSLIRAVGKVSLMKFS